MCLIRAIELEGIDNVLRLQRADAAQVVSCVVFNVGRVEDQRVIGNDGNSRIVRRFHSRGQSRAVPRGADDADYAVGNHVFHLGNLRRRIALGKLYVDVIASFVEILRQIFLVLQATGKLLRGKRDTDRAFGLRGSCRLRGLLRAIRRCGGFRLLGAGAKTNDKNEREKQGNKFFHYEFLL